MTIFFELIMEIKKRTFISNVFRYMYVKMALKCPHNSNELPSRCRALCPNILKNYVFLFLGWAEKLITYMCPAVYVLKTKHFLERGHFVGPDLR